MKKSVKILSSSFVLLVMLTNVSFAFTYSICEMTMKTSCKCEMTDNNKTADESGIKVHPKSCCTTEVKLINNSSDFERSGNRISAVDFTGLPALCVTERITFDSFNQNSNGEIIVFYAEPNGLPVKYSSLLI